MEADILQFVAKVCDSTCPLVKKSADKFVSQSSSSFANPKHDVRRVEPKACVVGMFSVSKKSQPANKKHAKTSKKDELCLERLPSPDPTRLDPERALILSGRRFAWWNAVRCLSAGTLQQVFLDEHTFRKAIATLRGCLVPLFPPEYRTLIPTWRFDGNRRRNHASARFERRPKAMTTRQRETVMDLRDTIRNFQLYTPADGTMKPTKTLEQFILEVAGASHSHSLMHLSPEERRSTWASLECETDSACIVHEFFRSAKVPWRFGVFCLKSLSRIHRPPSLFIVLKFRRSKG